MSPARVELARRYAELVISDDLIDASIAAVDDLFEEGEHPGVNDVASSLYEQRSRLREAVAKSLALKYGETELEALIRFYDSEPGRAIAAKTVDYFNELALIAGEMQQVMTSETAAEAELPALVDPHLPPPNAQALAFAERVVALLPVTGFFERSPLPETFLFWVFNEGHDAHFDLGALFAAAAREVAAELRPVYTERLVILHAQRHGLDELTALLAFYGSPPGRSIAGTFELVPGLDELLAEIGRPMIARYRADACRARPTGGC